MIGEAAHIIAAIADGPRGKEPLEKYGIPGIASPENAIWLCSIHHKQIDDHPELYPVEMLLGWKADIEAFTHQNLGRSPYQAPTSPTPHQIPAPPPDFTGRESELAGLLEAQASGACISGLRGLGGVGKSALAFKLAAALAERYPDGQLFIDMRGTSDPALSPAQAMAQVIRVWHPEERLPEDEAELSKLYRSLLHGKRVLLLLDNARDRAQVEPLLLHPGCFVLVTTRWRFALPGVKTLDLEALRLDEAVQLLLAIEPRLNGAAGRLAELCGCVPLALRVSASALAESPSLPVAEFLQKFEQARVQLSGMDASLRMSYDLLDPARQAALCRLSVFPAPFDRPAAAAVWELDEPIAQPALDTLVNASLLEWDAATGFRLHDLVRAFADGLLTRQSGMLPACATPNTTWKLPGRLMSCICRAASSCWRVCACSTCTGRTSRPASAGPPPSRKAMMPPPACAMTIPMRQLTCSNCACTPSSRSPGCRPPSASPAGWG